MVGRVSVLTKIDSGYLFDSDFSSISTEWEISDISRLSISDGLVIAKGGEPFFMFLSLLTKEKRFVLDVKNDYNPTMINEMGGIVIYQDMDNYICLEEYYDVIKGTTMSYPWLRLVRDYNIYTGYWSNDGLNWYIVGTQDFGEQSPKIGIFLEGIQFDMKVEYVRAFKSPYIDVLNPPPGRMQLVQGGSVLDSLTTPTFIPKVSFPVSSYGVPFEGRFRWENGTDFLETEFLRDLWGGDVFKFQVSMDLYYYNGSEYKRVETHEEEFLGYLNSIGGGVTVDRNVIKMKLRNPHQIRFTGTTIQTGEHGDFKDYSEYVALSTDGVSFSQIISLGDVEASSEVEFFLEIKRGVNLSVQEILFAINVYSNVEI